MGDQPQLEAGEVPSPALVAAWLRLGSLDIDQVPMWAAHWLIEGCDGPAVAELAGLRSSDSREARDLLPAALAECGLPVPPTRVAAAMTMFANLARLRQAGQAGGRWVASKVNEVLSASGYDEQILRMPLGQIYVLNDEWGAGWGRTNDELAEVVDTA